MTVIGLTGGIGSGKSAVSKMLAGRGAVVVDADVVAREVIAPGGAAYGEVLQRFGSALKRPDGTIDRRALAALVFSDRAALADLNALTHPAVREAMMARLAEERAIANRVVVADIPLLAEGGRDRWRLDGVLVVDSPVDVALERLMAYRGMDEVAARARIAAQAGREERLALADFVIDNSADMARLAAEVERAWAWIAGLSQG